MGALGVPWFRVFFIVCGFRGLELDFRPEQKLSLPDKKIRFRDLQKWMTTMRHSTATESPTGSSEVVRG